MPTRPPTRPPPSNAQPYAPPVADASPPVYPVTISSANCVYAIGMSWVWCRRFAAAHGVPVWRVGGEKSKGLIPTAPLLAALERVAAAAAAAATPPRELSDAERLAALRAELGLELVPNYDLDPPDPADSPARQTRRGEP